LLSKLYNRGLEEDGKLCGIVYECKIHSYGEEGHCCTDEELKIVERFKHDQDGVW